MKQFDNRNYIIMKKNILKKKNHKRIYIKRILIFAPSVLGSLEIWKTSAEHWNQMK